MQLFCTLRLLLALLRPILARLDRTKMKIGPQNGTKTNPKVIQSSFIFDIVLGHPSWPKMALRQAAGPSLGSFRPLLAYCFDLPSLHSVPPFRPVTYSFELLSLHSIPLFRPPKLLWMFPGSSHSPGSYQGLRDVRALGTICLWCRQMPANAFVTQNRYLASPSLALPSLASLSLA